MEILLQIGRVEGSSLVCASPKAASTFVPKHTSCPSSCLWLVTVPKQGGHHGDVLAALLLVVSVRLAKVNNLADGCFLPSARVQPQCLNGKRRCPCDSGGRVWLAHLVMLLLLKQINLHCLMNEHKRALPRSV